MGHAPPPPLPLPLSINCKPRSLTQLPLATPPPNALHTVRCRPLLARMAGHTWITMCNGAEHPLKSQEMPRA